MAHVTWLRIPPQSCLMSRLPSAQGASLESFTRLERLAMNGCVGMTSVSLNLPFLRHLSLEACTALTQVGLCRQTTPILSGEIISPVDLQVMW